MSISFRGSTIKCGDIHGAPVEHRPKHVAKRVYYFGRAMTTERTGGPGSRPISVECWVSDSTFSSAKLVYDYMLTLDRLIGKHGTLSVTFDSQTHTYANCTFDGAERIPHIGQRNASPIIDPASGSGVTPGSYWMQAQLMFTQLSF